MKLISFDNHAFKRAAKHLSQIALAPLSVCQERLAKAAGFRDHHEVQKTLAQPAGPRAAAVPAEQVEVASSLATSLALNAGDVLDALYRARFFGPVAIDPDDAITVRERIFEKGDYPQGGPKSQGSVCKTNIVGRKSERGILLDEEGLTRLMGDHGISMMTHAECRRPRTALPFFIPLRFYAVYGMWEEVDGSKVLFSRDYCPLWKITGDAAPVRDDPFRRVDFVSEQFFFDEGSFREDVAIVRRKSSEILKTYRVNSIPRLVELLPEMIAKKTWISKVKYARTFGWGLAS